MGDGHRNFAQGGLSRGWRGTGSAVTCDFTDRTVQACARGSLAPAPRQAPCNLAHPVFAEISAATSVTPAASQPGRGTVAPPTKEAPWHERGPPSQR